MRNGTCARATGILLALGATLVAGACANKRGGSVPYDVQDFGRPDVESVAPLAVNQRISPADELMVAVFGVEALSGEHTVDQNGFITMPLIGRVQASGKTAEELGVDLQARLGERYLRNPSVQVSQKKLVEQTVTVDGSVTQPGLYPIRANTTLQQAVALARGLGQEANPRRVVVFRQIEGKRHAAAFDLQAIRRAQAPDPVVYGNDIIIVDGNRSRSIFRDIIQTVPLLGIFRPF